MERIKLKNGSVWPDPTGKDYRTLIWRLRYAHDSLEPQDYYCAVEVMEAFELLITHPAFTSKEVNAKISEIRKIIKNNQK